MKWLILIQIFLSTICPALDLPTPSGYFVQKEIKSKGTIQLLADRKKQRNGILRLLNANGTEVTKKTLQKPRVDIEPFKAKTGNKFFFFVTEDWSIEFGSYNGPISTLYLLEEGGFTPTSIELMRSLKTDWKIREMGRNGFPEILKVSCRPDFSDSNDEQKFTVTYSRYWFDGNQWDQKNRKVEGFWENESRFPSETFFP